MFVVFTTVKHTLFVTVVWIFFSMRTGITSVTSILLLLRSEKTVGSHTHRSNSKVEVALAPMHYS